MLLQKELRAAATATRTALQRAFQAMEQELLQQARRDGRQDGCTAVTCLITGVHSTFSPHIKPLCFALHAAEAVPFASALPLKPLILQVGRFGLRMLGTAGRCWLGVPRLCD